MPERAPIRRRQDAAGPPSPDSAARCLLIARPAICRARPAAAAATAMAVPLVAGVPGRGAQAPAGAPRTPFRTLIMQSPGGAGVLNKTELVLLVLGACGGRHVTGMTRLTKLVFLSEREVLTGSGDMRERFRFVPDKFGPFTTEMYDQTEFLESVGMLEKDGKRFQITGKGRRFLEAKTYRRAPRRIVRGISDMKEKYARLELDDLLAHVYTAYPEYALGSEMRSRVAAMNRP